MTMFRLRGDEITVPHNRDAYNGIRRKYQRLAERAATQFDSGYSAAFKSIDDVHAKCNDVVMALLSETIEEAIRDLVAYGVYDVNAAAFGAYFSAFFSWDADFAEIDDKYLAIVLNAEQLDEHRVSRREGRGRWSGGGFGLSGAIQGATQAGAMNLATGAIHGTFNLMAKGVTALGDSIKKAAIFSDPATKAHLTNAVYQVVFNTHLALISALNDQRPNTITGYVSQDDIARSERLLENVANGRVPKDAAKGVLLEVLHLNPYDEAFYHLWLKLVGDQRGELDAIEEFFGVSVSTRAKKDLIAARKATLDFSTPEACQRSLTDLEAYALSIGYRSFENDKADILALAGQLDQQRRTVAGTTYRTSSEASAAQDDIARTVNGVVHPTHASADAERAKKTVGIGLGLLIFLVPLIGALFTLRRGYSKQARLVSFGWAAALLVFVLFSDKQDATTNAVATADVATTTPALPPVAAAAAANAALPHLALPNVGTAFEDLYAITPPAGQKVTLTSGEEAQIWYAAPIATDAGRRFVVMVARTHPERTAYADSAKIDVVHYREEAGSWVKDGVAQEAFNIGAMGMVEPLTKEEQSKIEMHQVQPGLTGLFLPASASHQGLSNDFFNVLAVGSGMVKYLGQIETGAENSGACDSSKQDGSGGCYSWKGQVRVEASKNGQPGDIVVQSTGTQNTDSTIVPAPQVRYVFEADKGYSASKGG